MYSAELCACIHELLLLFYLQRTFKMESEVENWIQTYDTEMGEKQVIAGNVFSLTLELFPQFFDYKVSDKWEQHGMGIGHSSLAFCYLFLYSMNAQRVWPRFQCKPLALPPVGL